MISGPELDQQQQQQQQQQEQQNAAPAAPHSPSFRQRIAAKIAYYRQVAAGYKQWVFNKLTRIVDFIGHFIPDFRRIFNAIFDLVKNVATYVRDLIADIIKITQDTVSFIINHTIDALRYLVNHTIDALRYVVDHTIESIQWAARKIQTAVTTTCFVVYGVCAVALDVIGKDIIAGVLNFVGVNVNTADDSALSSFLEFSAFISACVASAALVYLAPPAALALVVSSGLYKQIYPDAEEEQEVVPVNPENNHVVASVDAHQHDHAHQHENDHAHDVVLQQQAVYLPQLFNTMVNSAVNNLNDPPQVANDDNSNTAGTGYQW